MATISDTMYSKLSAHYPALGVVDLDRLTQQFATDNPTFVRPWGTIPFYSGTQFQSLMDAATVYWNAYVP